MSESIYNLVPREYTAPLKLPMHRSQHDPSHGVTGSTFGCHGTTRLPGAGAIVKKSGAIFGPNSLAESDTKHKSAINAIKAEAESKEPFRYKDKTRGPVPKPEDRPVHGITSNKNYVTANAVEVILSVPRHTKQPELNYLEKEDYGKIPEYLKHVKEEVKRENEMVENYVREQMGTQEREPDRYEEVGDSEREQLIYALKLKWEAVNKKYQKITHLVQLDTLGQVRRKETLEHELKTLEADIEKLQRNGPVLLSS